MNREENHVEKLFQYIRLENEQTFGIPRLRDMDEQSLTTFVDEQCDKHALNVLLGSEPNRLVETSAELAIVSREPVRNLEQVKEILNYSVNSYLHNLETKITELKNGLYKKIRNYQIEHESSHW